MTRTHTIQADTERAGQPASAAPEGFGAEFRELARQRRFVRDDAATVAAPVAPPTPRQPAAMPQRTAAMPERSATVAERHAAASAAAQHAARASGSLRISDDQRAVLAELARMSDRLVESREALATTTARADRADLDLAAANDRLMAARVLVHDAQHATHMSAERCAWLEGRCETLQEALDLAVNASIVTRWRWRRQMRATS